MQTALLQQQSRKENCLSIFCVPDSKEFQQSNGKRKCRTLDHQRLNVPEVRKDRTVLFQKNGGNVFTDLTEPGKKTVFYSLSVEALLTQPDMMQKIEEVLQYFRNRKDLALWLRPHPLYEQTLEVMRPQFLRKYRELLASYEEEGWGILDSGYDLDLAIAPVTAITEITAL